MAYAETVLALAADRGRPVDLHTDGEAPARLARLAAMAKGFRPGLCLGPCAGLSRLPRDEAARTADRLAAAAVTVVCLPQGGCSCAGIRGTPPVGLLRAAGVRVAAGSGALRDASNPVGRGDPLEAAYLLASQEGIAPGSAYDAVSGAARAALGLPGVRVEAWASPPSCSPCAGTTWPGRSPSRTAGSWCTADAWSRGPVPYASTWTPGPRLRPSVSPGRDGPIPVPAAGLERERAARRTVGYMRIVIAGGHGQIALRLERLLAARGDEAVGVIRNPQQSEDLREAGAEPVVLDLESASVEETAEVLRGADAVVFAAGAGPDSGSARKDTVDRGAAVLFADAAERAGVRRYVVVSSMGADPDNRGEEVFDVYQRAKGEADAYVQSRSGLDWTILRPGMLTNDAGTGQIQLAASTGRGPIPRDDVAAVLAELLDTPATAGLTLELISGNKPVTVAVKDIAGN